MSKFKALLHDFLAGSNVFRSVDSPVNSARGVAAGLLIPFFRTYFLLTAGFSLEPVELSSCGCPISHFEALLHDFLAGSSVSRSVYSPVDSFSPYILPLDCRIFFGTCRLWGHQFWSSFGFAFCNHLGPVLFPFWFLLWCFI
jgi:hypothetical protein